MSVRSTVVIAGTIVGLVLLISFKTPDPPKPRGNGEATAPASTTASPDPAATAGAGDPTPSPAGGPGLRSGTFAGQDVGTRFGDIQVQLVISGGRITDVKALMLPYDRPRSEEISQYVGPYLRDEVIQAQGANIDTISGATYTSDAYAQSVQSALDQAR